MTRVEIIANRSVEDEIIEGLEETIPGFYYTLLPVVHGRGKEEYCLGTATWPEENFLLLSYISDGDMEAVSQVIRDVKKQFPKEGIKLFFLKGE